MIVITNIAPQLATTATAVTITVMVGTAVSSCTVEQVAETLLAPLPVTIQRAGQQATMAMPVTVEIKALSGGTQTIVLSGWPAAGTYRVTLHSPGYENDESTTVVITAPATTTDTEARIAALEKQISSLIAPKPPIV